MSDAGQAAQLARLAEQVERLSAQLTQAEARLKDMGIHDLRTGLYSYRYLLGRAGEESARADRFGLEVSCLMIALDKPGFEGLLELARIIKEECRLYDVPARWGRHQLVMLLPSTDLDGALTFAERLRLKIEADFVNHPGVPGLTLSLGLATYPRGGVEDANSLVEAADAACHQASRMGGNRTIVLGEGKPAQG